MSETNLKTVSFIVSILLGLLSVNFIMNRSADSELLELEESLKTVEALAQFNNTYQNNEQKIVAIMNRFNKRMSAA